MTPEQSEIVDWLSPAPDLQGNNTETHTLIGTAMSDSVDGEVSVEIDTSIVENSYYDFGNQTAFIDLPTSVRCFEGDKVIVTLYGPSHFKTPMVTGVVGGGTEYLGDVLYDTRALQDITEMPSLDGYDYIEVFFRFGGGSSRRYGSVKLNMADMVSNTINFTMTLSQLYGTEGIQTYFRTVKFTRSGDDIWSCTLGKTFYFFSHGAGAENNTGVTEIATKMYISRIVGYR